MKRIAMIAALACSLAVAGPTLAQESVYDQNYEYRDYEAVTSGTVESFRIVNLQGHEDDHVIVRIQPRDTGEYEFAYVHLGPQHELRNKGIRIYSDQNITAHGQMGQIDGRPVLFADRVILDEEQIALRSESRSPDFERRDYQIRERDYTSDQQRAEDYDRVWPYETRDDRRMSEMPQSADPFERTYDRRAYQQPGDTGMYTIRGDVQSIREFDIAQFGETHRLIRITDTTRGDLGETTYIVDLGPTDGTMAEMDIGAGDRVIVQGHPARMEGRPVFHAVQISEVFGTDDDFARGPAVSSRLRRDSPEPSDSPSTRTGKPQHHDLPSRTSSDLRNW